MNALWQLDIAEASGRIAARELRVADYVTSVLERIRATEPDVAAWRLVDDAGAIAAADHADTEIARGRYRGRMHGIPFGVKDVIDTAGIATEAGSLAYAGRVPDRDAATVRYLRRAGGIVLGKTVTHEIAYGQNTPSTRNPWDASRYPGGSSVGSGVAVAVGSAPGCLGTDTGGSIRNPAAVNGVLGLRPSTGLVDPAGTMHLAECLDQVGPIARTAVDCGLLLAGMVSPARRRALAVDDVVSKIRHPPAHVRVGVVPAQWTACGITPEVAGLVTAALEDLRAMGVDVVDVELPELQLGLPVALVLCLFEAARNHRAALTSRPADFDPATRVMLELGYVVTDEHLGLARRAQRYLQQRIRATFDAAGLTALVSPTLASTAPLLTELATDLTRQGRSADLSSALLLLSPANVCGLPALSVPCGIAGGLPVGMHLLGCPFGDISLLRLAHHYQSGTSWQKRLGDLWKQELAAAARPAHRLAGNAACG